MGLSPSVRRSLAAFRRLRVMRDIIATVILVFCLNQGKDE